MAKPVEAPDVVVVGGGVIGLSVAWRVRATGCRVLLLERGALGQGASRVAAGMLAPVAEVEFGPSGLAVLGLGLRSARMWPAFAAELEHVSGIAVGLRPSGTLLIARDSDQARELERQLAFRESLGLHALRVRPSEARKLEPALAPSVRLGIFAPEDHSVDPRQVLDALAEACRRTGVLVGENTPVAAVELERPEGPAIGVRLHGGELVGASQVVIAAGAWSGLLAGLPEQLRAPVRPVKGQTVRLRDPAGPGLLERVLRYEGGYLVPRGDGRYVLGATMEERGFEPHPTVGGVYELLREVTELVPGVSELEIEELCVGHRPGTPDNAPVIGRSQMEGLFWATGHHRNGILLAPLTAQLTVAALGNQPAVEPDLQLCDPGRFIGGPAGAGDPNRRAVGASS